MRALRMALYAAMAVLLGLVLEAVGSERIIERATFVMVFILLADRGRASA